jgi:predicted nucleic acid-binding protein
MRIYLDNCCLNRPYDDLSNDSVRLECEAILSIIDKCGAGDWELLSSDVLLDEILNMTNLGKREKVLLLYRQASEHIDLTDAIAVRAKELERFNIKSYDALHLASAESGGADILLTTDRKFINAARKTASYIQVKNPLMWLTEVLYGR